MILTKEIKIKINSSNFKKYSSQFNDIKVGNEYLVSSNNLSKTSQAKINVKCDICGTEQTITYHSYIRNYNNQNFYTCHKCSVVKREKTCLKRYGVKNTYQSEEKKNKIKKTNFKKYGVENPLQNKEIKNKVIKKITSNSTEFIKKATKIHNNKYDYSLVNYINNKTKVKIICPKHGIIEQRPDSHLNHRGCYKCQNLNLNLNEKSIYILKDKKYNLYKIGISLNPKNRLNAIKRELKYNINVLKIFKKVGNFEKKIHKHFIKHKVNHPIKHGGYTEWFSFKNEDFIDDIKNLTFFKRN